MSIAFETEPVTVQNALQVLVVDDYDDNRDLIRFYLERQGIRVVEAKDGVEAIQMACASHPDIILMDLSMPVMDGYEATRQLKVMQTTRDIPIVAVSAHCHDSDLCKKAMEAGCTCCMLKPLDLQEIKSILKSIQVPDPRH